MAMDPFEAKYIVAGEQVLHREKVRHRAGFVVVGMLGIVSLGLGLAGLATLVAVGFDLQGLVGSAFFVLCGLSLGLASVVGSIVRVLITTSEVILHAGISHQKRIPLAAVTGVTLTRYDAAARQRVFAEGREAFVAAHPTKQLVQIGWTGLEGKEHVAFAASENPEALAEQIRRASAAAKAARVRIAGGATEEATDEISAAQVEGEQTRSA